MSRIFVVEDEAIVAEDIARTLRRLGYDVAGTAQSGMEALLAVEQTQPHLILMDIKLAGRLDGIQTTAAIRKRWSLPVIYLTSHSDEATLARAKETGPHGYLLKPFNERDLRTAIEVALRKQELEQRLEQRERWFSTTLDSVGDAVIATDPQERITFMNPVAERITGWKKEDAHLKPIHEVFKILTAEGTPVHQAVSTAIRRGFRAELPAGTRLLDRHGDSRDVDDSIAPIVDAQGQTLGSVVVFRDITDRRRLEQRVALSERLASISTMAAGMAHEINNPLSAATANIEFAARKLREIQKGPEAHLLAPGTAKALQDIADSLADAHAADGRVRQIVADLKKFARADDAAKSALDLPDVLDAAMSITRHIAEDNVRIQLRLGTTPLVLANEGRLVQVFANLIANAIQAGDRDSPRHHVEITTSSDDLGRAVVSVHDNGVGINSDVLPRIFEPFFTTRPAGSGLGLGLSICQTTVSGLGGELSVESQPGKGSTFRVLLPAAPTPEKPRERSAPPSSLRRGRVLVIDDEQIVGRTIERILSSEHDVHVETDARRALSRIGRGEHFDIILCDLTMPSITGVEVYQAVLGANPELAERIVFLTGGVTSEAAERFLANCPNMVVHKPFSVDRLLAVVASHVR